MKDPVHFVETNGLPEERAHWPRATVTTSEASALPFEGWLTALDQHLPEWSGWEKAIEFAELVRALAEFKIEERTSAKRRLEETLLGLALQSGELEYLEEARWRSWSRRSPPPEAVGALADRVGQLSSRLSDHAELRAKTPKNRSEERSQRSTLDALGAEIDALVGSIDEALAPGSAFDPEPEGEHRAEELHESTGVHAEQPPEVKPPQAGATIVATPEAREAPAIVPVEQPLEVEAPPAQAAGAAMPEAPAVAGPSLDVPSVEGLEPSFEVREESLEMLGLEASERSKAEEPPVKAGMPEAQVDPPSEVEPPHAEPKAISAAMLETKTPPSEPPGPPSEPRGDMSMMSELRYVAPPHVPMPLELTTFERFMEAFHLGSDRRVVSAPWHDVDFATKISATFDAELGERTMRFQRLRILAAATAGPDSVLPPTRDVDDLAAVWSGNLIRSQDATRASSIREAYRNAALGPTTRWRVAVLLEALAASSTSVLETEFIEEVVHQLELGDRPFESALIELLRLRTRGQGSVEWLRPRLKPTKEESLATVEEQLSIRRRELYDYFRSVMKAGGGKIDQTHCREAWNGFIERVLPGLKGLFPVEHEGEAAWKPADKKGFVDGVERLHAEVADRRGARLKDRVRMDRIAGRLGSYARAVNEAMTKVEEVRQQRAGRVAVETKVFHALLDRQGPPGVVRGLREILSRALFPPPPVDDDVDPLGISELDVREHPSLLELLPAVEGTASDPDFGRAVNILEPRAAAAMLLEAAEPSSNEPLPELLRARGRKHLLGKIVALCTEEDRVHIHAEQSAELEEARQRLTSIEAVRRRLADAASPVFEALTSVHQDALALLDKQAPRMGFFVAWLERVLAFGRAQLEAAGQAILARAEQQGVSVLRQVEPLISGQRFAEALSALEGRVTPAHALRHTQSRQAAATAFKEPLRRLAEYQGAPKLLHWYASQAQPQWEYSLRVEFAKLVFDHLYPKDKEHAVISVRCEAVRQHVDELGLNPCYLPQLQRFQHITIPRIGTGSGVRPPAPNFTTAAADTAMKGYPNDLVIVLAPRITPQRREEVLSELRRRKATAAVIDDLDLCRLLNPGGTRPHALLSLLEIALEQQQWPAMSPFDVVEGQHVQLEMYVGRRDEAKRLAHTSLYSRLFSGRKLGKSALLRYVEQRYDGKPLPSGNILRVLYVSAVGIDAEVALVDHIIACLKDRFGPEPEHTSKHDEKPAARLERVLRGYIEKQKNDSLLIVLDEADTFVEAELERYTRSSDESGLSWVMSRRIVSATDGHGLPRVRFVFTGYRVTNTTDGVWVNWGDVLELVPLPVDEAAALVATPLARLGIDASEQAAVIAHRCGYQPAVLLRFGEHLLSRLDREHPPATRQKRPVSVTADDVTATFEDAKVQDEIRRVTSNNFTNNDLGGVLFGALLYLFLGMGPAAVLEAAEDKLIERLCALDNRDQGWIAQVGGNLREQIKVKLKDLVARQLLVEHRLPGERVGYALKFPHHLTVLSPLAREDRLRDALRRLGGDGSGAVVRQPARGLLARGDFEVVRHLLTKPDAEIPIAPVVGHLWALPPAEGDLLSRGLFDLLNLERARVLDGSLPTSRGQPASRAFHSVHPDAVDALLAERPSDSPVPLLVGGVDLLRHAVQRSRYANDLQAMGSGRLSQGHLIWWFERARGFNFTQVDAIDRIRVATSGIPLLVSFLDRTLKRYDPAGDGREVTADMLTNTLSELSARLDQAAALLLGNGPETRLAPRELELLRMLAFAAKQSSTGVTSWEDLAEVLWPEYAKALPAGATLAQALPIRAEQLAEDQIALEVLELAGLVPIRPEVAPGLALERLGKIPPTDALVRLVERLPDPC